MIVSIFILLKDSFKIEQSYGSAQAEVFFSQDMYDFVFWSVLFC